MYAEALAGRIRGITLDPDPWPHATLDDFLPADVFGGLLASLEGIRWTKGTSSRNRKKSTLGPGPTRDLLTHPAVLGAVRERFGFADGQVMLEVAWSGKAGLPPHVDREDKLWNGQVYLSGDPKGTELYDAQGRLSRVVEWVPNRLTCWPPPGHNLRHAAPGSAGRYLLLWWILR